MRRSRLAAMGALLISLLLTGCWSRLETNELAVVIGYGIDYTGGMYQVTASVYDPKAIGQAGQVMSHPTEPAHVLMSGKGGTLGQALAKVNDQSSRRMMWGAAQTVVLGEGAVDQGINPIFSALTHLPDFRPTTRVVVAHGEAKSVFGVQSAGLETTVGRLIFLTAQNAHRDQSTLWAPHIYDLGRWEYQQQRAILIPAVRLNPNSQKDVPPLLMDDSAVLVDGRLVAFLPQAEVRPDLWIEGYFVHGHFQVPCPGNVGGQGEVFVTSGKRQVRPVVTAAHLEAIDLTLRGNGLVAQGCPGANATAMSGAADAVVAQLTDQSLQWAQSYGWDVFGFGETVYRHYPRLWLQKYQGDWPNTFSKLPVHLQVKINIELQGVTK